MPEGLSQQSLQAAKKLLGGQCSRRTNVRSNEVRTIPTARRGRIYIPLDRQRSNSHNDALHSLAADFFRVFSRTEYALKAAGFNNGEGPAEPNWSRFARSIEAFVVSPPSPDVQQAIDFLLSEPPRKQFIANGLMEWRNVPAATNSKADELFIYIRRVRNNLFHGGKFNGHWFAPERSEHLIRACIAVLRAAVEFEPNVRAAYHG